MGRNKGKWWEHLWNYEQIASVFSLEGVGWNIEVVGWGFWWTIESFERVAERNSFFHLFTQQNFIKCVYASGTVELGFQKLISRTCFYHPGPVLWVYNMCSHTRHYVWKGPMISLVVYCHCLEILNNFWTCCPIFSFCTGPWKLCSLSFGYHRSYFLVGRQMLKIKKWKKKVTFEGF